MKAKFICLMMSLSMISGIAADHWYKVSSAPLVYAAETSTEEVKERTVMIEIDYTGWTKKRIQEEINKELPGIFLKVAQCESQTRQYNSRKEPLVGLVDPSDTGIFQINKRYHQAQAEALGLDLDLPIDNIAFAKWLYKNQGLAPWSASKFCWNK